MKAYLFVTKIRIQSALAYRFNVIPLWFFSDGFRVFLAFLYGMSVLSQGLAVVLFIQTWYMACCVVEGEYDMFLLRPMGVPFQFLFFVQDIEYVRAVDDISFEIEKEISQPISGLMVLDRVRQ